MVSIENIILSELLRNSSYMERVVAHLKPEYFHDPSERVVLDEVLKYTVQYGRPPSKDALGVAIDSLDNLNEQQFASAVEVIEGLTQEHHDEDWLIDSTDKFIRDKAVYNAIMESIGVIDDEERPNTALPEILSDALAVSLDNHIGHDYNDDVESRYDFYHNVEERLPSDLNKLNESMKGGVPRKTLNIILAGINVGKSAMMCHLAASYLKQHQNVLYITMEMAEERIAERVDANILKVPVNDLETLDRDTYINKFKRVTDTIKGKLIVKEYPTMGASVSTFKALLKELQIKKKFKPDVVLIDYLGICASSRFTGSSENSYHYLKSVAEEVRGMAIEHDLVVWSAAQVNRSSFNDSNPDMTAVADSFGLPAVSDYMVAMTTSDELSEMGQVQMSIIKNRYSDNKRSFVVNADYPRMTFSNVSEDVQISTPMKADIAKKPQFGKDRKSKFSGIQVN